MCTVTYIPTPQGFILTHNRDEAPGRSPDTIVREKDTRQALLFPRDTKAGGTWITASSRGLSGCLLNGAFVKHRHQPPYSRSRGLLIAECMQASDPFQALSLLDLKGVEPFTFLLFGTGRVQELRWDGVQKYEQALAPDQAHFWCSATLYPAEMQARREAVFRQWYARREGSVLPRQLMALHRNGSVGDPENDYVMNRNNVVRTVSITQIVQENRALRMRYTEILQGLSLVRRMTLLEVFMTK